MQEEYLLSKMLKGKSEKERERELMQNIIETKEKLKIARSNFEYAEDNMIDYYIYQIKANQSKLDYLIKIAKQKGIYKGRPILYSPNAKDPQKRLVYHRVVSQLKEGKAISHIAKDVGITRQTVYRIKNELN